MKNINILDRPSAQNFVNFSESFGQRFILTVDTEEEFDWGAPLDREHHSLVTIPALRRFQLFCEELDVKPIYLIDYPVAKSPAAAEAIGDAVASGRAEVGVQLHPWVSPPFEEKVTEFNSYAGNLAPELEREKFRILRDEIETRFGAAPRIYRAGRYGLGPNTASILSDYGLTVDSSVRSRFNYSSNGGPNYREHPLRPYWIDRERNLLELPLTTVFSGALRQFGDRIHPCLWRLPAVRGMLSRAGLLERIPLTPEGVTAKEAVRGIDVAIKDQLPILVLSFHSPSLAPGHTPYIRTTDDLVRLYDWWRIVIGHLKSRNVIPTTISDIMSHIALA